LEIYLLTVNGLGPWSYTSEQGLLKASLYASLCYTCR